MFCSNSFTCSHEENAQQRQQRNMSMQSCLWSILVQILQQSPTATISDKELHSQHYANLAVEHTTIPSFPFLTFTHLNTTSFLLRFSFTVLTVRQVWLTSLFCSQRMRTECQAHRCSTDDLHMMEVGEITRVSVTSQFQTLQAQR